MSNTEERRAIDRAGQLYAVYLEAGGSCLKGQEPFPDHFPGQCNICGLLAVAAKATQDAVDWARSCSGESADAAADYIEEMATA